jgi:homeobox protein cut-like
MAQRDRLRARCDALEAERDSFKRELQVQVQASESLKTDNTKLYEKVRYLQSFNVTSGGSTIRGRNSSLVSDRDLDIEALESRYEASVDPFRQFSRAERQRKYNEMSPLEKVVFIVAKTTLGSKEMRKALFFYILGMHLLVFVTTYHWSHSSSCDFVHKHDALAHFHGGVPLPESPAGEAAAAAHQAAKLLP